MKTKEITNQYEKHRQLIDELRMLLSKKGIDIENPKNEIDRLICKKTFEMELINFEFQANNLKLNWETINTCKSMDEINSETKDSKVIEFHLHLRDRVHKCLCS
jgi:hypothetical protein